MRMKLWPFNKPRILPELLTDRGTVAQDQVMAGDIVHVSADMRGGGAPANKIKAFDLLSNQ